MLKWIAWFCIPYIMILFRWKKLDLVERGAAIAWSVFFIFCIVHGVPGSNENTVIAASPPVATSTHKETATQSKKVDSTKNASAKTATTPDKPVLVPMYKPGTVGKISVTLNSVNEQPTVGTTYLNQKANGIYWVLNITIKNNDSQPRMINESMFKIVENGGNSYQPDTTADVYANQSNDMILQQLNPGVSETGNIVFDMPKELSDAEMGNYALVVSSGLFTQTEFELP